MRTLLGEQEINHGGNISGQGQAKVVATYSYTDESGNTLFQKVRYQPKGFSLRQPDGTPGMGDVRRVLYRLPELMASPLDAVVFLVEGEKDADNLRAAGLITTTNFEGASKSGQSQKWDASYTECLHGRAVCIIPDKDAAGRARGDFIARQLMGVAADVRVVELPGNAVKDASDYLSAGGNAESLMVLFNAATKFRPADVAQASTVDTSTHGRCEELVMVCLDGVEREAVQWIWHGKIARGKVTLIAGDPGLGKSLLTMDIAARLTSGKPWPDAPGESNAAGSVLVLNCEDDLADTIAPRLYRAGADLSRVHYVESVKRGGKEQFFNLETDIPALEAAAKKMPDLCAIFIDPVMAYLGDIDSHKGSDVRALLAPLAKFAADNNVAVVCVTHLNKGSGPAIYRTMGSLSFVAAARAAWQGNRILMFEGFAAGSHGPSQL